MRIRAQFEKLDDRFTGCDGDEWLEVLHSGSRKTEGPAYFPAGRYLVWSDIPNDRMLRWDETTGAVGVFRHSSGNANGNTVDRQGRLLTCEQGARRVTRTEHDGTVTVLADRFEGKRLNSPNDIVEHSDGSIWFTDPRYGITDYYEGAPAPSEIGADHVYRIDPSGGLTVVADDFERPNGLAFTADESELFVVDTRRRHLRRFQVVDGTLRGGEVFAEGWFDGIRFDHAGRLWCAALDGLWCYHPDGTLIGKLLLPGSASNLVFGGARRNNLFITNSAGDVYSIRVTFAGASYPD
ncbi:gluconolactonase [Longispora fulva]|uniref:Gluconolactonase n=1 Tax=Longispora fulva TaxID=619741 RepID=A0A8J7GIT6_9ACTN|nr:SMP-30/gluconolactonase/LRE family protein [Longispora fulva]MBG6137243.1 gluconolactonase [Longispora fulva]GIG61404.1 gluconolactonase [Longispora fulva]